MHQNETDFNNLKLCDIDKRIRDNIIRLRTMRKLSQREFGVLTGVSYIGQIEAGHASAGKHVVSKMASALKVDPSEFYKPTEGPSETIAKIAEACASLSKEGQAHILEVIASLLVYEARRKWRE